jgi:hypothetical protein
MAKLGKAPGNENRRRISDSTTGARLRGGVARCAHFMTNENTDHPETAASRQQETQNKLLNACKIAALKAAPLFRIFGWEWYFDSGKGYVPSADQIEVRLHNLVEDVANDHTMIHAPVAHSSGGLCVFRVENKDGVSRCVFALELAEVETQPGEGDPVALLWQERGEL